MSLLEWERVGGLIDIGGGIWSSCMCLYACMHVYACKCACLSVTLFVYIYTIHSVFTV